MKKSSFNKLRAAAVAIALALIITGILLRIQTKPMEPQKPETYAALLKNLQAQGYQFHLPTDNYTGKTAIIIHDVDYRYSGAEVLVSVEREFGIRSIFYLRPDVDWFTQSIGYFKGLEAQGWQVGIQQDCLSRSNGNVTLALELFRAQVEYMRHFFHMTSSSYHGDVEYNVSISNFELYNKNPEVWSSLGLMEIYGLQNYSYIRDTDNKLVIPENLGDLVIVQLHADWWSY